jgi:hypothetical protein
MLCALRFKSETLYAYTSAGPLRQWVARESLKRTLLKLGSLVAKTSGCALLRTSTNSEAIIRVILPMPRVQYVELLGYGILVKGYLYLVFRIVYYTKFRILYLYISIT